ncbi:MAG TPA: hypothetical protein VF742_13195 [Terracidiphilus sp.]|jgi:hypothetical protein
MADALYLSLWYPNLRLTALPDKLAVVLGSFAAHGGEAKVYSVTVWPVSWHEAPVFQRVYGRASDGAEIKDAIADALELLHDDYAYEFQIGWSLWELEEARNPELNLDQKWLRVPRLVRVTAFGPLFDEGTYEQEGHIRIDFGPDAPFLEEDAELDEDGARLVAQNIRQLVDLTGAAEKASGATARLLWSELGESLAARLAARLGQGN